MSLAFGDLATVGAWEIGLLVVLSLYSTKLHTENTSNHGKLLEVICLVITLRSVSAECYYSYQSLLKLRAGDF